MSRRALLAVTLLAVAVAGLAVLAKGWCVPGSEADRYLRWCYSDVPALWFAEGFDRGTIPYLDHPVEYPVLTGGAMWLAAGPATGPLSFLGWTGLLLTAGAGVTAWLLAREVGWRRALAFAAAPTLLVSGAVNWDLLAVALATAGLVAHRRGADGWAGAWLGLGTAAKLYPALFLPPVLLAVWRRRGRRQAGRTATTAVGAWALVNVPVLLAAPDGWLEFLRLNRGRPSDWDALTTVAMRLTDWTPSVATLNAVTGAAFAVGAVAILTVAVRRDAPERWHLAALPLLAWFLLTSKVYSPQFSVWLLPLLALAFPGWRAWAAFAVADVAVTATRFPYLANFVGDGGLDGAWPWPPFAATLGLRAVVLAAVAWWGWRRAAADPPPGPAPRSPALSLAGSRP